MSTHQTLEIESGDELEFDNWDDIEHDEDIDVKHLACHGYSCCCIY